MLAILLECMTDQSDKGPTMLQIPSSGLASAGFLLFTLFGGVETDQTKKLICPSL
jgi:hypothetical protein